MSQTMRKHGKGEEALTEAESGERVHFGYRLVSEEEKGRLVRRHFDSIARQYDFMNTVLSLGIHYLWKRAAIGMMGLRPGDRVLDLCGGTGDLAVLAARAVGPAGRVVVYDINRAMMEVGRPKLWRHGVHARVRLVQGNAEAISAMEGSFDGAMVGFGIRNVTRMEMGFGEMHRALKPGGKMACLEFSRPVTPWFRWLYDLYSFHVMPAVGKLLAGSRQAYTYLPESIRMFPDPDGLKAMLETVGFKEVRYRRLTNGIAVIHLGVKA